MAVSNPAKMTSIRQEFGGPNNLKAYNRGGTYVPMASASTIATNANQLKISQFSGVIKPPSLSIIDNFFDMHLNLPWNYASAEGSVFIELRNNGEAWVGSSYQSQYKKGNWLSAPANNLLQVRIVSSNIYFTPANSLITYNLITSATNEWTSLSTTNANLTHKVFKATSGAWVGFNSEATLVLEFRIASTQQNIGSVTLNTTIFSNPL